MRPDRHTDALEDLEGLLRLGMIDRQAGIVDGRVRDAERVGDARPAETVDRPGPVALAGGVDLVDGHDLPGLIAGDQVVVVVAPPRRRVAAEGQSLVLGIGAGAGSDVEDAHLQDIAGLGAADRHRAGADMHAEAAAGADLGVHGAGTAGRDAHLVLRPEIDTLGARIALDHPLGVVARLMRERLDRDEIARTDLDLGLEAAAEEAPVDGLGIRRQVVMRRGGDLGPARLGQGRAHQRRAAGREGRSGGAGRREAALQEGAPLRLQIPPEPAAVLLEGVAGWIVARAHRVVSR